MPTSGTKKFAEFAKKLPIPPPPPPPPITPFETSPNAAPSEAMMSVAVARAGDSVLLQSDACGELQSAALSALHDSEASKSDLVNTLRIIHGGLGVIATAAATDGNQIQKNIPTSKYATKSGTA